MGEESRTHRHSRLPNKLLVLTSLIIVVSVRTLYCIMVSHQIKLEVDATSSTRIHGLANHENSVHQHHHHHHGNRRRFRKRRHHHHHPHKRPKHLGHNPPNSNAPPAPYESTNDFPRPQETHFDSESFAYSYDSNSIHENDESSSTTAFDTDTDTVTDTETDTVEAAIADAGEGKNNNHYTYAIQDTIARVDDWMDDTFHEVGVVKGGTHHHDVADGIHMEEILDQDTIVLPGRHG